MFSHVFIGTADFDRALAFYEPLMSLLGIAQRFCDRSRPWAGWQLPDQPRPLFLVGAPFEGEYAAVDRAHALALVHGGSCAGAPGPRPDYHANYYGAYFRDPDGNKLCAVCHQET